MATAPPQTKPSTPRLSDVARHVIVPKGAVSTAWPSVRDKCLDLGITFDEWQDGAGRIILAKRADGIYAASIGGVVISIPRQVGKTFLIGAIVFALCLLNPGMTVIWTAHQLRTANQTFLKMQAFARRKKIRPHVAKIVLGSGDEEIRFLNGSRILFGARERGFGLGFDEVDVLVLDEAQRVTEKALDDMVPATNQSRQSAGALVFYIGTPPRPTDSGEAFRQKREDALSGQDDDTAYIEFSADEDFEPTARPAPMTPEDWAQMRRANPSHPSRTPREAILRMRKNLSPDSMAREGFGQWGRGVKSLILPMWPSRRVKQDKPPKVRALGIAVSLDEQWGSIAACGWWPDDVEKLAGIPNLGAVDRREGSEWIPPEAKRIQDEHGCLVVVDEKCPDKALITALRDEGVELVTLSLEQIVETCSDLRTRVKTAQVTHMDTPELNDAVEAAAWRMVGDRKVFGRKQSAGDISMIEGAALALWGANQDTDPWGVWT